MNDSLSLDEQFLQRLPLPLAQLCRRSRNAKTPLERHLAAYYLWEAGLKLLGATAIVEYAELNDHDPKLTEKLKNLARPSVGHWWEFVRRLTPVLADKGDKGFTSVRDLVLGRARDDLPRAAGLDAALLETLDGKGGARTTVRLTELFDRLVTYRNREIGHGAAGQKAGAFYQRMSRTLFAGLGQILAQLDVLAGRRLVYIDDVRRLSTSGWLIERYVLVSDSPRRIEPLQLPESETARLPRPERVYIEGRRDPRVSIPFPTLRSLHPLVHFDPDTTKLFFLNARHGKKQIEYLCYNTGEVLRRESAEEEQRELLARVLGSPVDAGSAEVWAARSLAEEPAADAPAELSGVRSIGEFELLSRLGQGGMGVVYRAWQPSLGRQVALKCMLRSGDAKGEARFAREIRALGRIEHPNVVKVFTSGAEDDQWFYAMELIEGTELSRVCEQLTGSSATDIDEGRWRQALSHACAQARSQEKVLSKSKPTSTPGDCEPAAPAEAMPLEPSPASRSAPARKGRDHVRQVVEIVRQVAAAVHALHEAGVVHRDIKPGNIMLTADGSHPVLMDLGLAQLADESDGKLTRTRQFVGTLRYASPEQILAAGRVDRRTDIYSLGATLWELLTLQPLFGANEAMPIPDLMLKIQSKDPESPRKYNLHVPRDLEAIVRKCLEKDRSRRYATAGDLADDLGRFLRGEPVSAQPPSFRYLAGKFLRRYKTPLATAAAILLLLAAGAVASFVQIYKERNDAIRAQNRASTEEEKAKTALSDLQRSRKEAEVVWDVVDQAYTAVKEDNIRHLPGLSPVHEELASVRLEGMRQLAKATPDDPTVEPKLARAHAILGMVSTYVGSFRRARENLERAAELYAQLAKGHPDKSEYRLQECRALFDLGWLYWNENRKPACRRWIEQALERLEREYARTPSDPEVCFEIGRCLTQLGGCLPDNATKESREKLALRAIQLFEQLIEQKHREVDSGSGLALATYRLTMARFDGKDQQGLLKSLERILALEKAALKLEPASPYLNSVAIVMRWDRADALVRLGKSKEALTELEAAVAKSRAIVKRSPDVYRNGSFLAESLKGFARGLQRLQRAADARAAFEESNQVMDGLVERFPDRAMYARLWIMFRNELADFLEFGPKAQGEIQARQDLLRTLDQAVRRGREFAARFPDHYWLQVNFGKTLGIRGRYDNDAKRHEQALPYLLEAAEVYRTRVLPANDPPKAGDVTTYLEKLRFAADCASALGIDAEIIRLSQLALQARKHCTSRAGIDDLGNILRLAAERHRKAGRPAEAIQAYKQILEIATPALEKAPWHWYLRDRVHSAYRDLANVYRELKDSRNEVLCLREQLRVWYDQMTPVRAKQFLAPGRPEDAEEADKIRAEIKLRAGGMKRFTIPCDFNGLKYPFHVYIMDLKWPKHPLEDQARWLLEERGGIIPKDVMDSFERLHKVAHEHNVSFQDLCIHALGTATDEESKKLTIEKVGEEPAKAESSPETPGKAARDLLADVKARLVDLKTKLDNAPDDLNAIRETAQVYEELGHRLLRVKQASEAVEALRESARLRERLARSAPAVAEHRRLLADTFLLLGKAHVQLKEWDAAYNCFHRRLDLLEQLQLEMRSAEQRLARAECPVLFGELAEMRGDQIEALRWYNRAVQQKSNQAPRRIAKLLQANPKLAASLPKELQAIYGRVKKEKSTAEPNFIPDFVREVETLQKAKREPTDTSSSVNNKAQFRSLTDLADRFHTLAGEYLNQAKRAEALKTYLEEVNTRSLIFQLDSADSGLTSRFARALLAAGKVSIDLGKASDGLKLVERAWNLNDEKATFYLADLHAQGQGVPKDANKAASIRSSFTFSKGRRLYEQQKYAEALVEFERSVQEKPAVGSYQRIGWCQRKLGRSEEAVAAFKKGIEAAKGFNNTQWLVLDLIETALSANKPDEVFAVLQMLEQRKWSPEQTAIPHTVERELAGLHAIALHMAGKDASEAEKKLAEIVSRPNLFSLRRSRNVNLDVWLKDSRPSEVRQAAIKKILTMLDAPARELESPYFPLKAGRTWVYKTPGKDKLEFTTVRAVRSEKSGERKNWLLETRVNGRATDTELVAVELDGVYRQSTNPTLQKAEIRILPLPARAGDSWSIKSSTSLPGGVVGEGTTRVEDVTVLAGEFKAALVTEVKIQDKGGQKVQTVWYAKDVGPVKIATKDQQGSVILELEQVVKRNYKFDKSGRLETPTVAELAEADADGSSTIVLNRGTLQDGRPYWAYIAVKPSKYAEFKKLTGAHQPIRLQDYGTILKWDYGKEVPVSVKEEMKRKYGLDENYLDTLAKKIKEAKNLFIRQQEARKIADIIDMLKKKQGR